MRNLRNTIGILAFLLLSCTLWAQDGPPAQDDEFAAVLLIIGSFFMLMALGTLFLGIIALLLAAAAIAALAGAGILSMSVIYGLYRKSVGAGFRTFVLLTAMAGGAAIGAVLATVLPQIPQLGIRVNHALVWGLAGGLGGGAVLGWLFNYTLKRLWLRIEKTRA